jgi:hypothetical protein
MAELPLVKQHFLAKVVAELVVQGLGEQEAFFLVLREKEPTPLTAGV